MSLWEQKIMPMLAFLAKPFDSDKFLFEVKFDGTRCITYIDKKNQTFKFLNRRFRFFEGNYPEFSKAIFDCVNAEKIILDAELVIFEKGKASFSLLAEREHSGDKTRIEILSKINPATLVVFDILYLDGKDLTSLPLTERKKILERVVKENERVLLSTYIIGKGKKFFQEAKKKKLEGIVAKRMNSIYEIGRRSKSWFKLKNLMTLDCVIGGFTKGAGWREKYFGALILGVYDKGLLKFIGRVGTGLDEKGYSDLSDQLKKLVIDKCPFEEVPRFPPSLTSFWTKPEMVCEVRFMNLSSDRVMRAPSFIRLRFDKRPKDCELDVI